MRICDNCGLKMPRFRPRVRGDGGKMLCDGCANGRESRPMGYHGSKVQEFTVSLPSYRPNSGGRSYSFEGDKGTLRVFAHDSGMNAEAASQIEPGDRVRFSDGSTGVVLTTDPSHDNLGVWKGTEYSVSVSLDDGNQTVARPSDITKVGVQKRAHDSGDGATIYHCPFCGGGQVVGGSDGSVECSFCHTLFTVQVQPEHAAMPQTINGVPQDMPGMPGSIDPAAAPGAPPAAGATPGGETGTDAFVPPDAFAPPPEAGGTPAPSPGPPKAAALYLNGEGVAMPEESYMAHLAIAFADDPLAVIAQVREARTAALTGEES